MNNPTPCLSFIGIVDFSQEAKWIYMTDSVTDLLGFEPKELIGRPSLELVHPDEFSRVKKLHYDTIQQDKAAVLVYLRMRHKDPYKGYVLCGVSRTVVHNVLVGSVSFASPGAKALHNASTAQEITVITPSAANFEFRRWHDPSPMPPSPIPESMMLLPASPSPSIASRSSWSGSGSNGRRTPRNSQSPPAGTGANIGGGQGSPIFSRGHGSPSTSGLLRRSESGSESPVRDRDRDRDRDWDRERYKRPRSPRDSGSLSRSPSPGLIKASGDRRGSISSEYHKGDHDTRERDYAGITSSTTARRRPSESSSTSQDANAVIPISFSHLPSKSYRTALILDRFTTRCTILFCSNDFLIPSGPEDSIGHSFFDYVDKNDEGIVREWISCVKGWGVNEKGQPSDGGFGFGRFCLITARRDSEPRMPEPAAPSRHRHGSSTGRAVGRASRNHQSHYSQHNYQSHHNHRPRSHTTNKPTYSQVVSSPQMQASISTGSNNGNGVNLTEEPVLSSPTRTRHDMSISSLASNGVSESPSLSHGHGVNGNRNGVNGNNGYGHHAPHPLGEKFIVDAIFSAHSDGLMVILRRA